MSATPEGVSAEMRDLTDELHTATAAGDLDRAAALQRRLVRLVARFDASMARAASGQQRRSSGPTVREVVIGVVAPIGDVVSARAVRDLAAVDGTSIAPTGFPGLMRGDENSWRKNPTRKPVLLLPGLESTTLSPMKSWVTLSTFEPERRVVTPLTPRASHLRTLAHAVERLDCASDGTPIKDRLAGLVRRWSAAMPETRSFSAVHADRIRLAVEEALGEISEQEQAVRAEAAQRLVAAPPDVAFFGWRGLSLVEKRPREETAK
jgi:hypothetical protein